MIAAAEIGVVLTTFFFFVTYAWAQKYVVLHNTRVERLARYKRSSLLVPFMNHEKSEAF
jgi:hypothetical protein